MEESILVSIKKLLNIAEEYTAFDTDLIVDINSVIAIVNQLGAGREGFFITDDTSTWSDFLEEDNKILGMVKTYIFVKVRLMFDPPQSGSVMQNFENLAKEFESRINYAVDPSNDD